MPQSALCVALVTAELSRVVTPCPLLVLSTDEPPGRRVAPLVGAGPPESVTAAPGQAPAQGRVVASGLCACPQAIYGQDPSHCVRALLGHLHALRDGHLSSPATVPEPILAASEKSAELVAGLFKEESELSIPLLLIQIELPKSEPRPRGPLASEHRWSSAAATSSSRVFSPAPRAKLIPPAGSVSPSGAPGALARAHFPLERRLRRSPEVAAAEEEGDDAICPRLVELLALDWTLNCDVWRFCSVTWIEISDICTCANCFGLHKFEHVEIPYGTRKKLSESQQMDERRDWKRQLVQTLVDKYNDHHHLSEDLAYELKNVLCLESVAADNGRRYYHINFTMKTKGADDFNCGGEDLFFGRTGGQLFLHGCTY
ncbi:hypothetical protein D1007_46955 [Hordeum vulgare]|nr:hypothetical protein D1007_46955 [Hordeum vulgare]